MTSDRAALVLIVGDGIERLTDCGAISVGGSAEVATDSTRGVVRAGATGRLAAFDVVVHWGAVAVAGVSAGSSEKMLSLVFADAGVGGGGGTDITEGLASLKMLSVAEGVWLVDEGVRVVGAAWVTRAAGRQGGIVSARQDGQVIMQG